MEFKKHQLLVIWVLKCRVQKYDVTKDAVMLHHVMWQLQNFLNFNDIKDKNMGQTLEEMSALLTYSKKNGSSSLS